MESIETQIQEVKKDIDELQTLLTSATRKKVQDLLSAELRKMETQMKQLEGTIRTATSSEVKPSQTVSEKCYNVTIRTYSWDQSDKYMKLYITLPDVHNLSNENVRSTYEERSFQLEVTGLSGKHYHLNIRRLADAIKPSSSYHKVKTDMVVIFMAKKTPRKWDALTAEEKKLMDSHKPKTDTNPSDPTAGLMDLMQKMYDDGDDEMKRMLNKTWYESQQKKMTEADDF